MKKISSILALAAMCAALFTACGDDNDSPQLPQPGVKTAGEVLVLNVGNIYNKIDGSLNLFNEESGVTAGVFKKANGRSLGGTPNDILVYGSKVYVVCTDENTIEVMSRHDYKSITRISTTGLMGTGRGKNPRRLAACDGLILVDTYDGYIASIDTTDFHLDRIYTAGSYPEGMAVDAGKLYVVNSDYGQGANASISIVDLAGGKTEEYRDELITNPSDIAIVNGGLYVLNMALYDQTTWEVKTEGCVCRISPQGNSRIAPATMMAACNMTKTPSPIPYYIYMLNATFGNRPQYSRYDAARQSLTSLDFSLESPHYMAVDPASGHLYIASSRINPETGYADYNGTSYVQVYDKDGNFVRRFDTGAGQVTGIAFNRSENGRR